MKRRRKAQQKITCSIGIGQNKIVAKIAADFQKLDGLTIIKSEQVESFLSPLPVGRLIGVERRTETKWKLWELKR